MGRSRKRRTSSSVGRKHKSAYPQPHDEIKFMRGAASDFVSKEGSDSKSNYKAKETIRIPHLTSTKAEIKAMDKCTWGITSPDKLGIKTQVVTENSDWKLNVLSVNSVIRSYSRLLAGQKEPVPGVNTTKNNFQNQINVLNTLGTCAGKWYMIRAVRAHENMHVKEWKDNFNTDWAKQKTKIESLKVPASGETEKPGKAHSSLRAQQAFEDARQTTKSSGNYPVFWGIADPNPQTDAAEKAIVNPRIEWICKYAKWNKWSPSTNAVCASKKIT